MDMGYNMGGGGLDLANLIGTMVKNNDDWGNGNGSWLWFLLILLLFNRNGNWGDNCNCGINEAMEAAVNKARANDLGDQVVLEAVKGNRTAIMELANTLNVDASQIQTALGQLTQNVQAVSNQIGLTSQQTINAIQQGNQNIIQQLCNCLGDSRQAIQ